MHRKTFGIVLLISGVLTAPAYAVSLEAFSGAIAGLNECPGGGAPAGMYAFFGAGAGFGIGNVGNGISDCGLSGGINDVFQSVGPALSASNLNYTGGFGGLGSTYSGTANATANYGSVSASITGALSGPDRANGVAESAAYGITSDTWNIGGGSGSGYAKLSFNLDAEGSLTTPVSGSLQTYVDVQLGSGTPEQIFLGEVVTGVAATFGANGVPVAGCTTTASSYSCTNATISTIMLPVTFGTDMAFDLGALLGAEPGYGVSVDPDLTLSGIQIYNAAGNPLSDFTITSGSGAVYGANGIESAPADSPEPATLLLTGCALMAIGGKRWRKRGRVQVQEDSSATKDQRMFFPAGLVWKRSQRSLD